MYVEQLLSFRLWKLNICSTVEVSLCNGLSTSCQVRWSVIKSLCWKPLNIYSYRPSKDCFPLQGVVMCGKCLYYQSLSLEGGATPFYNHHSSQGSSNVWSIWRRGWGSMHINLPAGKSTVESSITATNIVEGSLFWRRGLRGGDRG